MIQDLPYESQSLTVNAVGCFGYQMLSQRRKEKWPWVFKIGDDGEVNLQMIKVEPQKASIPQPSALHQMLIDNGITESLILQRGPQKKEEVDLRFVNNADVPVTIVGCDCTVAFGNSKARDGDRALWPFARQQEDIQPGDTTRLWGNFKEFHSPTGWFTFFVRYKDWRENRVGQEILGTFNVFQIRSPVMVIVRVGGTGQRFGVDMTESKGLWKAP